jgi:hypothetical protein
MGEPSKADRRALERVSNAVYGKLRTTLFQQRGFSNRVVDALVQAGIDAPERLLFMTETELHAITGIGRAGFAEIAAYRSRFTPAEAPPVQPAEALPSSAGE